MNIAVIGAGVVGRLTSLALIQQGLSVCLFDKAPLTATNTAGFVSAGMICPISESGHAHPEVVKLGFQSLVLWPAILESIQSLDPSARSIFYRNKGSLVIDPSNDQKGLQQFSADIQAKVSNLNTSAKPLSKTELSTLEPSLNSPFGGYLLQPEAQLCNRDFLSATNRILSARCNAIELSTLTIKDIHGLKNRFDYVVDCRGEGAISNEYLKANASPLRGVRGEVIRVQCPEVNLQHTLRVLHPRHPIYIVPKANNTFVIGATEIESSSQQPISVRSTLELLNTLYSLNPAFAEATILETNVGVRAAYLDNAPQLLKADNLISVNGLYRHGWLTGPAISQQIIHKISQGAPCN